MANKQSQAEILYMLLADALYSCDPTESVKQAKDRVLRGVNREDMAALESLIVERRKLYAKEPVETV